MLPIIAWPIRCGVMADAILRSGAGGAKSVLRLRWLVSVTCLFGFIYGAAMGSFGVFGPARWQQLMYSAVKVPLLVLVSFALSVPSFYVFNALVGLARDFPAALRALAAAQSSMAIVLASLAPLTLIWYASSDHHPSALAVNGIMFAVATLSAQIVLARHYRPLIKSNPRHRAMLVAWLIVYAFVAIQFAWIMRPFVGDPHQEPQFFRRDVLSNNAYVVVIKIAWRFVAGS